MSWLRRTELWLPIALLVVAGSGSRLLLSDRSILLSERDRHSYGERPAWQACFDAVSATCGVGLLTYRLEEDYTPAGRWVLAGLGVVGAVLFLAAARSVTGRLWGGRPGQLPSTRSIVAAFLGLQLLAILVVALVERATGSGRSPTDSAWNAIAAFSSLGWLRGAPGAGHGWLYATVSLVGALGWPVWMSLRRPIAAARKLILLVASYALLLACCAGLITGLELPRGMPGGKTIADDRLAREPVLSRFGRAAALVTVASGAGATTEELGDRRVGEGTKAVVAIVVLIGGLGGTAGSGIKWWVLLSMMTAMRSLSGRAPEEPQERARYRDLRIGTASAGTVVVLVGLVTAGLLLIESRTGSPFQSPPTLGDAVLDATSAVAGAGLSSGLSSSLTNVNLSTGIRQNVDLYQYGMTWLMLAMLVGRILPLLVLGCIADVFRDQPATPTPPVV